MNQKKDYSKYLKNILDTQMPEKCFKDESEASSFVNGIINTLWYSYILRNIWNIRKRYDIQAMIDWKFIAIELKFHKLKNKLPDKEWYDKHLELHQKINLKKVSKKGWISLVIVYTLHTHKFYLYNYT